MKRTKPLKRYARLKVGKPPKRGAPPKRKTPLKPRGKKGSRFPRRRDSAFTAWLKEHVCILAVRGDCWHPLGLTRRSIYSDPAHVIGTRGAGARDYGACIPMCRKHHREQEGRTPYFDAKYGVDLVGTAHVYAARYDAEMAR